MTKECIEEFRKIVIPFVRKRLLEIDYEKLGKSDAEEFTRDFNEILNLAIKALEQEPTTKNDKVDCEHTDCNNCVNHKYCDYEPTTKNDLGVDCISRAEAIKCLECHFDITGKENMKTVVNYINSAHDKIVNLPRVKQEPRKGHWIEEFVDTEGEVRFTCSSCGKYQLFGTDFCYNCGAKMVEPQESEDV